MFGTGAEPSVLLCIKPCLCWSTEAEPQSVLRRAEVQYYLVSKVKLSPCFFNRAQLHEDVLRGSGSIAPRFL